MNNDNQPTNETPTPPANVSGQRPSVGRIVHYKKSETSPCLAAIITRVNQDGSCTLQVFDPTTPQPVWASVGEEGSPDPVLTLAGSWHFPERV